MMPAWIYQMPMDLICRYAIKHGLDRDLVTAIVMKESSGISTRTRFEPGFKYLVQPGTWAINLGISPATEEILQKISWGPMQVMGGTARELGFQGQLPDLARPEIGLDYGCKYLKAMIVREHTMEDAVAAYNAGDNRRTPGGFYINQKYVDVVMAHYRELTGS